MLFRSLSIQLIATALALIAYVLAAGHIGGLDIESTRKMVTATLICMAVTAVMQAWGGKFGAGLLLVQAPTSMAVSVAGIIVPHYGAGGMLIDATSEERRFVTECVSPCRLRWPWFPEHTKRCYIY